MHLFCCCSLFYGKQIARQQYADTPFDISFGNTFVYRGFLLGHGLIVSRRFVHIVSLEGEPYAGVNCCAGHFVAGKSLIVAVSHIQYARFQRPTRRGCPAGSEIQASGLIDCHSKRIQRLAGVVCGEARRPLPAGP